MAVEFVTRHVIEQLIPPDSPIERLLSSILFGGPGTNGITAIFGVADTWQEAIAAVRANRTIFLRNSLAIFPQVSVLSYRPDYLVVTAAPRTGSPGLDLSKHAFFVEADGKEYHSAEGGHFQRDLERQRAISKATGLDFLRFSGGELHHAGGLVHVVIGAKVAYMHACQLCGEEAFPPWLSTAFRELFAETADHPAVRRQATQRNDRASNFDAWDVPQRRSELDVNPYRALSQCLLALEEVRSEWLAERPYPYLDVHGGESISAASAVTDAVLAIYERWKEQPKAAPPKEHSRS